MAKYYGIDCGYGANVVNSDGERMGTVKVFGTKAERDAWVESDHFDGNWHRAAITGSEARHIMMADSMTDWNLMERKYGISWAERRSATMEQLADAYACGHMDEAE